MPSTSEAIRQARDMDLPSEAAEMILEALPPDEARRFARELLTAAVEAQETNDLRPVTDVIQAWYRTLLFKRHTDVDKREEDVATILKSERRWTVEELQERFLQR